MFQRDYLKLKKMKTHTLIALLSITYLCSGCLGKLINPDKLVGGTMSCTVNGQSWEASEASGLRLFGTVSLTGSNGSGKNTSTLLLAFDKDKAKAGTTIDLNDATLSISSELTSYMTTVNGVETNYLPTEGKIKITAASGSKIEGTFSLKGEDITGKNKTITIENGKFSVNLLL